MVKQATSEGVAPTAAPATTAGYSSSPGTAYNVPPRFAGALKGIRIAQLVLGIVVLGLTAYLVYGITHTCIVSDDYFGDVYCVRLVAPGQVSFNLFAGLWTFLICLYLIPAAFKHTIHQPIAALVLDALSVVFWFAGFISLAVLTGFYADYTGDDFSSGFGILIAAVVFGVIEWILFVFTLAVTALGYKSNRTSNASATPMQQYPNQGVAQHA